MQTIALELCGTLDGSTVRRFCDAVAETAWSPRTRTIVFLTRLEVGELRPFFALVQAIAAARRSGAVVYIVPANRRIASILQRLGFADAMLPDDVLVCADGHVTVSSEDLQPDAVTVA